MKYIFYITFLTMFFSNSFANEMHFQMTEHDHICNNNKPNKNQLWKLLRYEVSNITKHHNESMSFQLNCFFDLSTSQEENDPEIVNWTKSTLFIYQSQYGQIESIPHNFGDQNQLNAISPDGEILIIKRRSLDRIIRKNSLGEWPKSNKDFDSRLEEKRSLNTLAYQFFMEKYLSEFDKINLNRAGMFFNNFLNHNQANFVYHFAINLKENSNCSFRQKYININFIYTFPKVSRPHKLKYIRELNKRVQYVCHD